ncbi:MAG TPA: HD domain-containing protein [Synergistaceae bacterium]|nr:HD domain-containing protein [Synergistaceae bacterium]
MIRRSMVERLFSAASIERWNDHPRPIQFTELGKQAHKMIIAYLVATEEERRNEGAPISWTALIEGGIFEFLHRVLLTDIKPPIFHMMMEKSGEKLNRWVLEQLEEDLRGVSPAFRERFENYFFTSSFEREKRILRAAHYLATKWEFGLVYHWSQSLYGIEETRRSIDSQLEEYQDIPSVQEMLSGMESYSRKGGLYAFLDLVGQLRFQKRWSQTPRIPQTSVLDHMLCVAFLAYVVTVQMELPPLRGRNAFLGGLFHDLPEVLTRDIISPVKRSVEGLEVLIEEYEREAMHSKVYPLLSRECGEELRFFTEDVFFQKLRLPSGEILLLEDTPEALSRKDIPRAWPLDGVLVEICDKLAAYVEASLSIRHGVTSPSLEEARRKVYQRFGKSRFGSFDMGCLFDFFR